jgi:glycosyltransferase involved in cell wall biosynthesis
MKQKTILLVIPVYNEETVLEQSIEKLHNFFQEKKLSFSYHICIADNGSTDNTGVIAKNLSKTYPHITYFYIDQKGRGRTLKKVWIESSADIVSYMDVDLSTDLEAFPSLITAILNGADIATGSRYIPTSKIDRKPIREFLSRGYNLLLQFFFRISVRDSQCGFKALSKKTADFLLPKVKDNYWFFDTELLLLADYYHLNIIEIPIRWEKSKYSKVKIPSTAYVYIKNMIRMKFRLKHETKNSTPHL